MPMSLVDALAAHPFTWFGADDPRNTAVILCVSTESETAQIPHIKDTTNYYATTDAGSDRAAVMLENTQTTIRSLAFFAWAFALLSAMAVGLSTWYTGVLPTWANGVFTVTAGIMVCSGLPSLRPADTLSLARGYRLVMSLGVTLGLLGFTLATGLLVYQMVATFLFF